MRADNLIRALAVVANVKPHEKLRIVYSNASPSLIIDRTWLWAQGAVRFVKRDSRNASLSAIESCVEGLAAALEEDEDDVDDSSDFTSQSVALMLRRQCVIRASNALRDATRGLDALSITYRDDEITCARLTVLAHRIEDTLARIKFKHNPNPVTF